MHHDEGGLFEGLAATAYRQYEHLIPDQIGNTVGIVAAVLIVGFLLWRSISAGIMLHTIAETCTDRSLVD